MDRYIDAAKTATENEDALFRIGHGTSGKSSFRHEDMNAVPVRGRRRFLKVTAAIQQRCTGRISVVLFQSSIALSKFACRVRLERLFICRDHLALLRCTLFFAKELINFDGPGLAFYRDPVEQPEIELRARIFKDSFAGNDRGPVLLVQAFQTRSKIHCVANGSVIHPIRRTEVADQCLVLMQTEASLERPADCATRLIVKERGRLRGNAVRPGTPGGRDLSRARAHSRMS